MCRSAAVLTVVEVVFEPLLLGVGSAVPSLVTVAEFWSTVPSGTEEATVTWTVKTLVPLAARPEVVEQVTFWPTAEQPALEPELEKLVPLGSVSLTWKPPTLTEGPLLVTVNV